MGMLEKVGEGVFTIVVEFTPHSRASVEHIAKVAQGLAELNEKYREQKVEVAGISLTQNPGGSLSYDHLAAIQILREKGFPESLEICPHVTGKDMNRDGVRSLLQALCEQGIDHVLALTGDLSSLSKGVFEVDSLGLLRLIKEVNAGQVRSARNLEALQSKTVLTPGAAVSPYKYTNGSLAMQLIKARKKIGEGARFLTCQSGWDAQRAEMLRKELADISVPLIGNALVLSEPAAKYMQTLPGCVVTDNLLKAVAGTTLDDQLVRAGRQVAMFKQLGYQGVDLGNPAEFKSADEVDRVIAVALETENWRDHQALFHFPAPENPRPAIKASAGASRTLHNTVFEPDGALHHFAKTCLSPFEKSYHNGEGGLYRFFNAFEGFAKGMLYQCEHCGDCFLPENDFVCTMGECEKGLDNPPCGDADPRGICGNNENRVCVGEKLYYRLKHHRHLSRFVKETRPSRLPALEDTASILNYFFERDHTRKEAPLKESGLIQIAELIHASIPAPGAAMQEIQRLGEEGFTTPNKGLMVIEDLIKTQAEQGADFIDINIDALGHSDPPAMMRQMVRKVYELSGGTPPCVDSSDPKVLLAGLEEWFKLGGEAKPLANSIPLNEMEKYEGLYALRKTKAFNVVNLLLGVEGPLRSKDEMVQEARKMFQKAREAGFEKDELFFDCVTLGIASDGCMDGMGNLKASHTHHSFQAIQAITQDPEMRGVHAVLGVSNWVYGAKKRRIGHIRAFIAVAQKHGLDAAIVDVSKEFGIKPTAPELMGFVETFLSLDGSEDSMMTYSAAMQEAREKEWI